MVSELEIRTATDRRWMTRQDLEALARAGVVRVDDLLGESAGATHATFESRQDDYRASIPLPVARRGGKVILEESGSLRLLVEDGETLCWNVKDLGRVRTTDGAEPDSVPPDPPH